MNSLTIATFNTEEAAIVIRNRLRESGIPAELHDQKMLQRVWFLAKPYAAYHIEVPQEHLEPAQRLMSDWQADEAALSEALRCPECGSLKVEYPQMSRKFITPTLVAHGLALLGILHHRFYCVECHHTWPWPTKNGPRPLIKA